MGAPGNTLDRLDLPPLLFSRKLRGAKSAEAGTAREPDNTWFVSRYAGFAVLLYIFNDDKGSPVIVELFFILLLDVYSSSSGSQLIDWAEALAYILLH